MFKLRLFGMVFAMCFGVVVCSSQQTPPFQIIVDVRKAKITKLPVFTALIEEAAQQENQNIRDLMNENRYGVLMAMASLEPAQRLNFDNIRALYHAKYSFVVESVVDEVIDKYIGTTDFLPIYKPSGTTAIAVQYAITSSLLGLDNFPDSGVYLWVKCKSIMKKRQVRIQDQLPELPRTLLEAVSYQALPFIMRKTPGVDYEGKTVKFYTDVNAFYEKHKSIIDPDSGSDSGNSTGENSKSGTPTRTFYSEESTTSTSSTDTGLRL